MSKRDLKKFVNELTKSQLEEQIISLYDKFIDVKVYYNFVFQPNENKLAQEAKIKISNEYFPVKVKKPKMRRSVAQKIIKHFIVLGVDEFVIADLMLYTIEIALAFSSEKTIKQELFYKSMLNSYQQAVSFMVERGILPDFQSRVEAIAHKVENQKWMNVYEFTNILDRMSY
jgi:hypothetical protein